MNISFMPAGNIKLYNIFRKKLRLSDEDAEEAVSAVDEVIKDSRDDRWQEMATTAFVKDQVHEIKIEMHGLRADLSAEMHKMEVRLIHRIYWAGLVQIAVIIGALIGVLKFMFNM